MFQSGTFWLLLVVTVPLFWAFPKRLRLSFLTLVSMAYLSLLVYQAQGTLLDLQPVHGWPDLIANIKIVSRAFLSTELLLGWTLLFYFLAPLTVRGARAAGVGTVPAASPARVPEGARRWIFWLLIGGMLVFLAWFKFADYPWFQSLFSPPSSHHRGHSGEEVLIPLGISYFTFKFIHYVVEVARGNIKNRSLPQFFCYIYLYPIFSEGPIERFDHFLANQQDRLRLDAAVNGLMRIVVGLIKKFAIADMLFSDVFAHANGGQLMREIHWISPTLLWGSAMGIYLYEYFDFAGYTDIAIGACQLFGLGIMENFDWPLLAPNIGTFWKRWHMTLTGWCISYVYMPVMGATRRPNLATYVTFVAIGLWHAASPAWLLWGLYQATGLVIYQAWARFKRQRKWNWGTQGSWSPWTWPGIAATFLFISAGELIPFGGVKSFHDAMMLGSRLIFLHIKVRG